jgi:chromodomain-helicase-DNA-binding protein 1
VQIVFEKCERYKKEEEEEDEEEEEEDDDDDDDDDEDEEEKDDDDEEADECNTGFRSQNITILHTSSSPGGKQ